MGRLPAGWKKLKETSKYILYGRENYQIFVWKTKPVKVECFKQLASYKKRIFMREFRSKKQAIRFIWRIMRLKEIRYV